MTLSIKHKFTSPKGDGTDPTLVQPSKWNDDHTITLSADKIIGRGSDGAGDAVEITCTAQGRSILASANVDDLLSALGIGGFRTGDVKLTLRNSSDPGWLLMDDDTIGKDDSGAAHEGAEFEDLYELIWTNISNTWAPVTGGRGGTAAGDWAAGKPLKLTKVLGRALAAAGAGSGLTSRALGSTDGAETHALTVNEMPKHTHGGSTGSAGEYVINKVLQVRGYDGGSALAYGPDREGGGGPEVNLGTVPNHTHSISEQGGDAAHNNVQPTTFLNVMVKL